MSDPNILSQISKQTASCYTDELPCDQLSFIAELQTQRKGLEQQLSKKQQKLDQEYQTEIGLINQEIETATEVLQEWLTENRHKIPPNSGKTIKFISGQVSWRNGKESLVIDEPNVVITNLKKLKLGQYLNMKVTVDKTALAKASPALQLRLGIHKERGQETLTLTPNNGEKIELK